MKTRALTLGDLQVYSNDIFNCYKDNPMILDAQSPYSLDTPLAVQEFLAGYIEVDDSMIKGVFDDREEFLYAIVIFDNMRITPDGNTCEVHIASSKSVWGRMLINIYKGMIRESIFDNMYCMIPANCVLAIRVARQVGFNKTGYIPRALPYKNSKGLIKMYDLHIYSLEKGDLYYV